MVDELINRGVAVVGDELFSVAKGHPVIVVGTARGGTSMVAGCLHHLGVFMGDKAHPPVYEDVLLAQALEAGDIEQARQVVDRYKAMNRPWGWKRPSSIDYLPAVDEVFEQPAYVFVFKDLFSIAQRNSISMLSDVLMGMQRAHQQYGRALDFIGAKKPRAMLVSYEKAIAYPDHFLEQLTGFCGLAPSVEQQKAARSFIDPAPEKYLDVSRITKAQGRLGGVTKHSIFGWARFVHQRTAPEVQIFLNDSLIVTASADQAREDLLKKFGQNCGYNVPIPEGITLQAGDVLRARVKGEVRDLDNSPLVL